MRAEFASPKKNKLQVHEVDKLNSRGRRPRKSLLDAGGTADHVHLLISQSKNIGISSLMKDVKKDSSSWIKTKGREFRNFHWQDGYGAFSLSKSDLPSLQEYLASQKEHHRKRTFQAELIQFLDEYGIQYDERYLWN